MPSTTSGTVTFNLDVDELIEQALDPIGGEHQSGIDAKKARRTLNLILITLQNKNIPLNKIDFEDVDVVVDDAEYALDTDILDVLEANIVKDGETLETPLERKGIKKYHELPDKTQTGRPNSYLIERGSSTCTLTLWPVPDGGYTAKLLVSKKIEDVTAAYQKLDINPRYLPFLTAWLTYELAKGKQGIPEDRLNRLKADYLELMPDTFEEDRERADFVITIGGISGR